MKNSEKTMEKIVALCKGRGFVFPGSEIYGGLANTWDYGPLGVELKNNVKKAWWQKFVTEDPHNVGVDCAILMNPQTWVASGHLGGFSDPLMDCWSAMRDSARTSSSRISARKKAWRSREEPWTDGPRSRWRILSGRTPSPAPAAANTILQISVSLT